MKNIQYLTARVECVAPRWPGDEKDSGGISTRQVYLNYTRMPVTVVDRTGLRFHVDHIVHNYKKQFIIRTEYTIPSKAYEDLMRSFILAEEHPDDYPELTAIRGAFQKPSVGNRFAQQVIVIDTIVDETALKNNQSIYVANKDLLLTLTKFSDGVAHPFGKPALVEERYNELTKNHRGTSTFVEIVDNNNELGERYYYAAKRIFRVVPVKDLQRESGIYLGVVEQGINGKPVVSDTRFSLEEGEEKLGLYKTQEEAFSAGDVKALRQEELARLQFDNNVATAEIQRATQEHRLEIEELKSEAAREENARKLEIATLEAENDRLKRERQQEQALMEMHVAQIKAEYELKKMKDNDYYEQKSHRRKDSSETLKVAGAVITAGLALYAIISKAKKE